MACSTSAIGPLDGRFYTQFRRVEQGSVLGALQGRRAAAQNPGIARRDIGQYLGEFANLRPSSSSASGGGRFFGGGGHEQFGVRFRGR